MLEACLACVPVPNARVKTPLASSLSFVVNAALAAISRWMLAIMSRYPPTPCSKTLKPERKATHASHCQIRKANPNPSKWPSAWLVHLPPAAAIRPICRRTAITGLRIRSCRQTGLEPALQQVVAATEPNDPDVESRRSR